MNRGRAVVATRDEDGSGYRGDGASDERHETEQQPPSRASSRHALIIASQPEERLNGAAPSAGRKANEKGRSRKRGYSAIDPGVQASAA